MSNSISTFFDAWSMDDADARTAAISQALAASGTYADPRTPEPMTGAASVSEYVAMFAQAAPGATATVVASQTQHGLIRATVAFRMADGKEQLGQYFVALTEDGKIASMTGFVGTGAPE